MFNKSMECEKCDIGNEFYFLILIAFLWSIISSFLAIKGILEKSTILIF